MVADRSRGPLWAQYEGRCAASVSVIAVFFGGEAKKVLLYAQNSLVQVRQGSWRSLWMAAAGMLVKALDGGSRDLGEVVGWRQQGS